MECVGFFHQESRAILVQAPFLAQLSRGSSDGAQGMSRCRVGPPAVVGYPPRMRRQSDQVAGGDCE